MEQQLQLLNQRLPQLPQDFLSVEQQLQLLNLRPQDFLLLEQEQRILQIKTNAPSPLHLQQRVGLALVLALDPRHHPQPHLHWEGLDLIPLRQPPLLLVLHYFLRDSARPLYQQLGARVHLVRLLIQPQER